MASVKVNIIFPIIIALIAIVVSTIVLLMIYQKRDFNLIPLVKIFLFITSLSIFLITSFSELVIYDYYTDYEVKLNNKIIMLFGVLSLVSFNGLLNEEEYGRKTKNITSLNLILGNVLLGYILSEVIFEINGFIDLKRGTNGIWFVEISIIFGTYIIAILLLSAVGLYFANEFQFALRNNYVETQENSIPLFAGLSLILGGLIISISLMLGEQLNDSIFQFFWILGLVGLLNGTFILIGSLVSSPFANLFLRRGTEVLFENKLVGWALFTNTDMGPTLKLSDEVSLNSLNIKYDELLKFGFQEIMMAYNNNQFSNNVSITPLAGNNEIVGISTTFQHHDLTITDKRLKNTTHSVFVLFVPTLVMHTFSRPLGSIDQINGIVENHVKTTKDIEEFAKENRLLQIAQDQINMIF